MLSDIEFPKSEEYRTGTEHEPLTFYMESLVESNRTRLHELKIELKAADKTLNVYQLDMPDGVSNSFRNEIEVTI